MLLLLNPKKIKKWTRNLKKQSPPSISTFPLSLSPKSSWDESEYTGTTKHSRNSFALTTCSASSYLSNELPFSSNHTFEYSEGPSIKPYTHSVQRLPRSSRQSHSLRSKSPNSHQSTSFRGLGECFICGDLVLTKLDAECLYELKCGSYLHEQCVTISIDYKIYQALNSGTFTVKRSELESLIFPLCAGNGCEKHLIEFSDDSVLDKFITRAITQSIEFDKTQLRNTEISSFNSFQLETTGVPIVQSTDLQPRTGPIQPEILHPLQAPLEIHREASPSPDMQLVHPVPPRRPLAPSSFRHHTRTPSFLLPKQRFLTNSYSRFSSLRSETASPINSILYNNDTIRMVHHKNLSLETLQNLLLRSLLTACPSLSLNSLVKFGNLRLADNLVVKTQEKELWATAKVFLFDNFLVICQQFGSMIMCELNSCNFSFEHSLIRIVNQQYCISLDSNAPSILEKWVIALSDFDFDFPCEFLTSTLSVSEDNEVHNIRNEVEEMDLIIESGPTTAEIKHFSHNRGGEYQSSDSVSALVGLGMTGDSDEQVINDIMATLTLDKHLQEQFDNASVSDYPSDSESDLEYDSDREKIKQYLD